ncbi:MAG: cysteine-rich small domain-containing protein [Clostridia bacterium]|nr:cysteine-rich small domain-containing protein [Clostridia bacterium]
MSDNFKLENYKFFSHKECEFFPCHECENPDEFNCLFCYCPLYALGNRCGGNFKIMENGIKDCSECIFPHRKESYEKIVERWPEIAALNKR